jgi:hypothetical protein
MNGTVHIKICGTVVTRAATDITITGDTVTFTERGIVCTLPTYMATVTTINDAVVAMHHRNPSRAPLTRAIATRVAKRTLWLDTLLGEQTEREQTNAVRLAGERAVSDAEDMRHALVML